jgi:hypothetical protein
MTRKTPKNISIAIGVFAIMQTSFGIGMITCCVIMDSKLKTFLTPYWSAIPLLLTGFIGIVVPFTRNQCILTVYLLVNIFITLIVLVSIAFTWLTLESYERALSSSSGCRNVRMDCRCERGSYVQTLKGVQCHQLKTIAVLVEILTTLGCLGAAASLATCICGCMAICCLSSSVSEAPMTIEIRSRDDRMNVRQLSPISIDEDVVSSTSLEDVSNDPDIIRYRPTEGIQPLQPPPPPAPLTFQPAIPSYVF